MPSDSSKGAFVNVADKLVLLLEKTRDTLLKDLEKEFSGLRKALEQLGKDTKGSPSSFEDGLDSTKQLFSSCEQVIKAVFAQVGMDISQCKSTGDFMNLLGRPLDLVDSLADDIETLTDQKGDSLDYGAILESVYKTVKDLVQLVKDFQNVEMDKIEGELETLIGDAYKDFNLKDFAMSLLEYVFITILRNGREVFDDEIKYVKLQANSFYNSIKGTVEDVKGKVQDGISDFLKQVENDASKAEAMARTLFKETVQDMEDVYNSVAGDLRKEIDDALSSQTAQDIQDAFQKVSSALSKVYAILDFLGIVGKKTVEIKLPESFLKKLNSAANEVSKVVGQAAGEISGYVKEITETANGTVSYGQDVVKGLTSEAHNNIQKAATQIDNLTGTSLASLDITGDLVNVPAINIPDFSKEIDSVGKSMQGAMQKYAGNAIDYLKGLSFPINITTFRWGKIEKMFSDPETYFKEQYPVDSIEDAENIVSQVLEIARLFNPLIPDFKSIRSLLESLLKELGEQVLTAAKEVRNELWEQVKPLMTMIRKVIDVLEEMYQALKDQAHIIIQEIRRTVIEQIVNPVSDTASQITDEAKDFVKSVKEKIDAITVPKNVNEIYKNIIEPSILEAVKKSTAPDPEKVVSSLEKVATDSFKAWGSGVSDHLSKFFSEKEWKDRIDGTISALETTFVGDAAAVRSFLSPSSLDDLASIGSKASSLRDQLDISQYIKVISEAFDGVSVPNPELYYEGFKQCVSAVLAEAEKQGAKFNEDQVKTFVADVASGMWEKIRNKVINPVIKEIKKQILKTVRKVIKNVINDIIDQLPSFKDLNTVSVGSGGSASSGATVKVYDNAAKDRIKEVRDLAPSVYSNAPGNMFEQVSNMRPSVTADTGKNIDINIGTDWIEPTKKIAQATVEFSMSDLSYSAVIKFVVALYKAVPESAKEWISDILPSLPDDNGTVDQFCDFVKDMDYKADLDESFAILTVLDAKSDKDKEKENKEQDKDKNGTKFNASALLQLVVFAGTVPEEKKEEKGEAGQQGEQKEQKEQKDGEQTEGDNKEEEKKEPDPALYCMLIVKGNVGLTFGIGSNHIMSLSVEGGVGGGKVEKVDEDTAKKLQNGVGFYITKGWDFKGVSNLDALNAMFLFEFKRKGSEKKDAAQQKGAPKEGDKDKEKDKDKKPKNDNPLKVFDSKYLSLQIGDYPQLFYLGYSPKYPGILKEEFGIEEEEEKGKKDKGKEQPASQDKDKDKGQGQGQGKGEVPQKPAGNSLQVGYIGALQDASVSLHLQDVVFIKEVIKDDVSLNFDTYLWYDYHKGFDFGGDVSLHMDFDLNHKKLGPLTIETFTIDAGSVKDQKGKLGLVVGTTFQLEMSQALVVAVENLGVGLTLNYLDEKGNFGDFDIDGSIKFPTGFGITVDASAVKGGGFISINQETGEFFGVLDLNIINKIGVGGFLLCDPGTAKGHFFSLVVLLSARFNPGIPLGLGFSLTAVGGTLGLNRELSRDAIQNGVRTGSLDQVFFVQDIQKHLAEMKSNVLAYFPAKKGQFFFGILGEISFEPLVKCAFGLLLQLPKPTEIIIVGALKVNAAAGLVRINVYFAGGINFEEGMWFDSSIVDSKIVGLSISGDMAFRLNWGGQKGFLISIGGFHPAYKPEEGLHVGTMNRLAMKLDYSILKISFESYLAVTSNTFQIGARLDLNVGWEKFGLVGYASYDALFQFDPFMFLFNAQAAVSVQIGNTKLLTAYLNLDVQGPAPWIIAGYAKFTVLLIPVKVKFTKTWGDRAPELPSETVEVFPILETEWKKDNNWSVDNGDTTGNALVALFSHKSTKKVIQPDGSLTFNQSSIPFYTQESLEKMDLCNNAVPSDYDSLKMSLLNGQVIEKAAVEQNDFAPALYKNMTIREKLDSESYVKYNSGFTLDKKDKFCSKGQETVLKRNVIYETRSLEQSGYKRPEGSFEPESIARLKSLKDRLEDSPLPEKRALPLNPRVTSDSKDFPTMTSIEIPANNHRDRSSFDRYVAALDSRMNAPKSNLKKEGSIFIDRRLKKGEVYTGKVSSLHEFGAYVNILGQEALLHITELSWERTEDVSEVLKIGQEVKVKLIDIDEKTGKIKLSLRELMEKPAGRSSESVSGSGSSSERRSIAERKVEAPTETPTQSAQPQSPWDKLNYKEGDNVRGKVVLIADYGALVEIEPGLEGIIHVSEMSWGPRLHSAHEFLKDGDEVDAQILTIDRENRKMSLGLRQLTSNPWENLLEKYPVGSQHKAVVRSIESNGVYAELENGIEGYIYNTDLSWKKIKHPSEVVAEGDTIDVQILELDEANHKLSLGHKQLTDDPWEEIENKYPRGSIIEGTINSMTDKNASITLKDADVECIAYNRELLKEDGTQAVVGETLLFKVVELRRSTRRILLSHLKTYAEADSGSSKPINEIDLSVIQEVNIPKLLGYFRMTIKYTRYQHSTGKAVEDSWFHDWTNNDPLTTTIKLPSGWYFKGKTVRVELENWTWVPAKYFTHIYGQVDITKRSLKFKITGSYVKGHLYLSGAEEGFDHYLDKK